MAFAEAGDREQSTECIAGHGAYCNGLYLYVRKKPV
jgi:hypothetical protein